jgi:long-subunit fatty acid transport protein
VEWPFATLRQKGTTVLTQGFNFFHRIQIESIAPACAFRIGSIAIGISPQIMHVRHNAAFPYGNDQWEQGRGLSAYDFEYKQDGWTYGLKAGAMWLVSTKMRIGASVQSPYKAELKGWARSSMFADTDSVSAKEINLSSEWHMPLSCGLGMVHQIGSYSEINIDVVMDFWAANPKQMDFTFSDSQWAGRLAQADSVAGIRGSSFVTDFQNVLHAGVGFEYMPPQGVIYRAGYRFSTSPVKDESYSLLFPGVHQHWFSCGIGYISGRSIVDLSIAYSFGIAKQLSRPDRPFVSGKYNSYTVLPVLSYRYQF